MKVEYEKSCFTTYSEYLVQIELTIKGFRKVTLRRFFSDKDLKDPSENVNIHPDVLNDLIEALQECRDSLGIEPKPAKNKISLDKKREIQKRYLRGVSIKDLCTQFQTKPLVIEQVLLDAQIEIVLPKHAKPFNPYRNYRRKPSK